MYSLLFIIFVAVNAKGPSEFKCPDGEPVMAPCENDAECKEFNLPCLAVGADTKYCCGEKPKPKQPAKKPDPPKEDPPKEDPSKKDSPIEPKATAQDPKAKTEPPKDEPCPETPAPPTKTEPSKPDPPKQDPPSKPSNCRDIANDCKGKLHLCIRLSYDRLMRKYCMDTCNFCDPTLGNFRLACKDYNPDCAKNEFLCHSKPYNRVFVENCMATCKVCG
ncbi:hypothetical protein M3Y94_01007800 [Aphelenchoides besseyi]|nr:hypothetical protein M3Y94_01007800 [Aphelenchoides besseyi]KAI6220457.1 hypothetical protein M3Y95_01042000 [Aphelenchoides besseyi]